MRVAIVTPYLKEPREWLQRCIDSVRAQTHGCEHLLVADGHPQDWVDQADVRHLRLDRSHGDYGSTPRSIGAQLAVSEGFDAIAFLDGDNWLEPDHVATCVAVAAAENCDVVTAKRTLVRADGSKMNVSTSEDDDGSHVDTSCFFVQFGAFHTLPRWLMMPKPMAMLGDRFYLSSLRAEGLRLASTQLPTVNYLCTWADVFRSIGEAPPPYAKEGLPFEQLRRWVDGLRPGDLDQVRRLCGVDLRSHLGQRHAA